MSNRATIELLREDITTLNVDAIVNAANNSLLGGGGVDGAIHRAAGDELLEECRALGGCVTGEAKITKGYKLPARYIIHTVGPVWEGGHKSEKELLAACYYNSLQLAQNHDLKTIAFPNISTGVYGFPKDLAAEIALKTINDYLTQLNSITGIIFAVFDEVNFKLYNQKINKYKR